MRVYRIIPRLIPRGPWCSLVPTEFPHQRGRRGHRNTTQQATRMTKFAALYREQLERGTEGLTMSFSYRRYCHSAPGIQCSLMPTNNPHQRVKAEEVSRGSCKGTAHGTQEENSTRGLKMCFSRIIPRLLPLSPWCSLMPTEYQHQRGRVQEQHPRSYEKIQIPWASTLIRAVQRHQRDDHARIPNHQSPLPTMIHGAP